MDSRRVFLCAFLAYFCFLIPSAPADSYPVILHGKVEMEDGSPPPVQVTIERVCSDLAGSMPGVLTDKKGEYIWRMQIDPLESRNCVIRATHAGYSSTEVEVSGIDTTHTTLDLAPIKIRPAVPDPYTLNFSDAGIPGKAKQDWKAAIQALDNHNMSAVATHLEAVVAAAPKAGHAWHDLGIIDDQLDKPGDARAAYEKAIAADSKLLPAYVTLARLCLKTKDWACAAKSSDALIKIDNKHTYPEIYLHQAVARYELKDLSGAQESVEEAIRLDPQHKLPREEYVLGRILEAKGDVAGAKQHMAQYLKLEPAPQDVETVKAHLDGLGKTGSAGADPDLEVLN
jgi:Flp pilus assembly protein TadD